MTPSVSRELLEKGNRFSFIQAVRLLRHLFAGGEPGDAASEGREAERFLRRRLRTRPALSLDFPPGDIVSVERDEADPERGDARFRITAAFLGLYGASSPLPTFYTEDLFEEAREDASATREFLDIVNSPLYPLLFMIWSKYRLGIKVVEERSPRDLERLFCLAGFGDVSVREGAGEAYGLIRYAGLFTQSPRSALGLERLLTDALDAPRLSVIPAVPRKARIPDDQLLRLGMAGKRLSANCFLGRHIRDRMGQFRIRIGPVDAGTFLEWRPDGAAFDRLRTLVRVYMDQPLQWDLEVVLDRGEVATARPGVEAWGRLGWSTWLFSGEEDQRRVGAVFKSKPLQTFTFSENKESAP